MRVGKAVVLDYAVRYGKLIYAFAYILAALLTDPLAHELVPKCLCNPTESEVLKRVWVSTAFLCFCIMDRKVRTYALHQLLLIHHDDQCTLVICPGL